MKKRKKQQKGHRKDVYCDDCIICDFLREKELQGLEPDFEGLLDAFRRQNEKSGFEPLQ